MACLKENQWIWRPFFHGVKQGLKRAWGSEAQCLTKRTAREPVSGRLRDILSTKARLVHAAIGRVPGLVLLGLLGLLGSALRLNSHSVRGSGRPPSPDRESFLEYLLRLHAPFVTLPVPSYLQENWKVQVPVPACVHACYTIPHADVSLVMLLKQKPRFHLSRAMIVGRPQLQGTRRSPVHFTLLVNARAALVRSTEYSSRH